MKIIYIISFPPAYHFNITKSKPDHFWFNTNKEVVGIWRQDHGHLFAKDVKRYHPEIDFEVWRPDYRAEKEYKHVFSDGVIHRSFPAQKAIFWKGLKPEIHFRSKQLFAKFDLLIKEHFESRDLICHIPLDFSYIGYKLLNRFGRKIPFFHTSHLNPHLLNVDFNTRNPIKYLHRLLIQKTHERFISCLGKIAVSKDRIDFIKGVVKKNVFLINSLNQFDFNWAKDKVSRNFARQQLNLPSDRKIFFSSSRLVSEKQIDKLLKAFSLLKNYNFLYIISGNGTSEYEQYLKDLSKRYDLDKKVIFKGYLNTNLIYYYCASDVFISSSISEGGPGSAIKALSLELPVITTNTGIVSFLLIEKNAGLVLEKTDPDSWASEIVKVLNGMVIRTIDSKELEMEYGLEQFIRQLVFYYSKTLECFYMNNC